VPKARQDSAGTFFVAANYGSKFAATVNIVKHKPTTAGGDT